jgi:hypothetical protein
METWPHLPNLPTPRFFSPLPRGMTFVGALTFGVRVIVWAKEQDRKKKKFFFRK